MQRNLRTVKPNSNSSTCIKNKKGTFGTHFMDSEKMGYSKDDLAKAHKNCDQQYTTKVNRQFITLIHNAMFPADSKPTPAILRFQDLIDSSTVKGVMEGTAVKHKPHDNNKTTESKVIATCMVCQKTGHKAEVSWFGAENKIRDAELALANAKDEGAPILKTKRTTASERKVLAAGVVTNTSYNSSDSE